ncbi:FkbM family methyltransferase [Methylosinus sporium]|uniref:FkbM family methyltransferase n=1 Tax=Methylosinus sporium TaxID=428 RepID=A0A549SQ43_METSR|nr:MULTISPECIES: FkbM family methyltransferase [Methylosinus]MBU3888498.1 FkbM family methyltransferase [Methylosinus sp. KRF6]TRL31746.1 FkbM family methyltransferase [Methylosinus sporium]
MAFNILANLRAGFRRADPLRYFVAKVLVKTGLSVHVIIDRGYYRLRFFPSGVTGEMFIDGPSRLREDEQTLFTLLNKGDVYVDIGANVGSLLFTAKHIVGVAGLAIGVEPHPRIFGYLKSNAQLNSADVILYNVAIGSRMGRLNLSDSVTDEMNAVQPEDKGGISIEAQTLDDLLYRIEKIDLLKIDVEGYELEVLKGAASVLDRTRMIYFESWIRHSRAFGYTTADLITHLQARSFSIFKREQDGWRAIEADHVSRNCENLLAIRNVGKAIQAECR